MEITSFTRGSKYLFVFPCKYLLIVYFVVAKVSFCWSYWDTRAISALQEQHIKS